ncbi:hypothetical protein IFM89_008791, partial [Coptis chinensis]
MKHEDYVRTVYQILKQHVGSEVRSFGLYSDPCIETSILEEWLDIVKMKGVKEVDLDFSSTFNFPHNLLDGETSITTVKLTRCVLSFPDNFNGLRSLTSLTLEGVHVNSRLIDSVTRNCLFLENLALIQCRGGDFSLCIEAHGQKKFKKLTVANSSNLWKIEILVPTLSAFHYRGSGRDISTAFFGSFLRLEDVVLDFINSKDFPDLPTCRLDLGRVTVLTISSTFLEGNGRKSIFIPILKEVQFLMEETSYCNPYDIASFLTNCSHIERIFIDLNGFSFNCGHYWEFHNKVLLENLQFTLSHLKSVKVKGFKLQIAELSLVKFFLEKSPVLETMVLVTPKNQNRKVNVKDIDMCRQKFFSWQLSPRAKVDVFLHSRDRSSLHPTHSKL